jgi:hypothetical protein
MMLRILRIIALFLLFVSLASILPNAQAQTTSITDLSYPTSFDAGSLNPISVRATVGYRNSGPGYSLLVEISNIGEAPAKIIPGIATSSPDRCVNQPILAAYCQVKPNNSTGVEHLEFKIGGILGNPQKEGEWNLNMTAALATANNTLVENSGSTVLFTITVPPVILTLRVPAAVAVTVDGVKQPPGPVQLPVSAGAHNLSVPITTQVDNTTRLKFDSWADGFFAPNRTVKINSSESYEAVYVTQYRLTITGQAASATGQGWYDAGSIATFSVANAEPMNGTIGLLGGKLRFQGWYEGNKLETNSSTDMIVMDKPHTLTVLCRPDYTIPLIITLVVPIILVLAYLITHRRAGAKSTSIGPVTSETSRNKTGEPSIGGRKRTRSTKPSRSR